MAIDKIQSESINLADTFAFTGTVTGAGDSSLFFQAYHSASQSISAATTTKLNYPTELFDTGSKYDTSTSRYTPGVVGKYFVGATIRLTGSSISDSDARLYIKLNNANEGVVVGETTYSSAYYPMISANGIANVTSTSDYFEVYHFQKTGNAATLAALAVDFPWSAFYGYKIG